MAVSHEVAVDAEGIPISPAGSDETTLSVEEAIMVGGDTDALLLVAEAGITISPVGSIDGTISVAGSGYVP